ncbi:MAG: DUF1292 domain-containing protein [Clostridia bacterium]|jgi:hypothetical protein|nr:DUF1292 domain-containing protein [Clostridia bacterium]
MSDLLDQLNDEEETAVVTITDTDGKTGEYEFLDLVFLGDRQFAVVSPTDSDGDVVIFRVMQYEAGEAYIRVHDDVTLLRVFDVFRLKNEDEFDFD